MYIKVWEAHRVDLYFYIYTITFFSLLICMNSQTIKLLEDEKSVLFISVSSYAQFWAHTSSENIFRIIRERMVSTIP